MSQADDILNRWLPGEFSASTAIEQAPEQPPGQSPDDILARWLPEHAQTGQARPLFGDRRFDALADFDLSKTTTEVPPLAKGQQPFQVRDPEMEAATQQITRTINEWRALPERVKEPSVRGRDIAFQQAGAFGRSFARMLADAPRALAIAGAAIERATGTDEKAVAEQRFFFRLGNVIEGIAGAALPVDDPRLRDRLFATKIPEWFGTTAGFVAGGAVSRGSRLASMAAISTLGAAVQSVDSYEDAKAHGADEKTALKAAGLGAPVGAAESLAVGRILGRFYRASPGIRRAVWEGVKGATENIGQEVGQTIGANLIARGLYDPKRPVGQNIGTAAEAGGIVGGLFSIGAVLLGGRRFKAQQLRTFQGLQQMAAAQPEAVAAIMEKAEPSRADFDRVLEPGEKMSAQDRKDVADALRREFQEPAPTPRPADAGRPVGDQAVQATSRTPAWLQDTINRNYAEAERLGLVDDIERLSAERLTALQIIGRLKARLPAGDQLRHKELIQSVRSKLDIPSMDDAAEFERWITSRKTEAKPIVPPAVQEARPEVRPQPGDVAGAKQAWEMTWGAFRELPLPQDAGKTVVYTADEVKRALPSEAKRFGPESQFAGAFFGSPLHHKTSVAIALREGKPVPPEVLRDYPDLERKVPSAQEARTPVEAPGREEGIEGREEGRLRVRDVTKDRLEAEAGEVAERRVRPAPEAPMKDVMSGPFKLPGLTGQFVVSTERGGTLRFFAAGGAVEAVARRQADGSWRPATGIMALSQERIAPLQGIIENAYQLTEKARAGMPAERKVPRALPLKTQEGLQRPAEVGAQIQPEARAEAAEVRPLTGVPVRAAEKPSSPAARMLATEERVRRLKEERPVRQREEARAAAQALKPIGDIKASVAQAWAGSVSTEAGRLVSDGTMAIDTAAISEADATKLRARPSGTVQRVTQKAMEDVWKATMRDAPHAARPVGLHSLQGGGGVQGGDVVVLDLGEGKAVGLNPKKYAYLKRILGAGVTLYGRDVKSPIVFKKAGKPVALLMPVNIGEEIDLTPRGGASRREGPLPGGQAERARILRSAGWTPMPFSAGVISRPGLFPFLAQTLPAKAKETIAAVKKAGRERGALSTILSRLRGDKGTGSERQRDMVRQFNSLMDLVQADPENAYRLDRAIVGESPVHDLPLEAQHWVRNARRLQDEASNLLIDELIMSYGGETKLTESIHRNLGTYLHETLIPESASQRLGQFAARKLKLKSEQFKIKRDRWIVQFGKSFEKFDTEAEARGFYQDMIHQRKSELIKKVAKARGVTADDLKRAAANAKGKIKLLPPIPEEARREIFSRNPIYQWSVSYAKTVHNAATLRTFRLLERRFSVDPPADVSAGGDKAVEEWAKENKLEKLTAPRETIGVLHGKYVPKRVAKEVNELVALPSLAMRIWRMYLNLWKSSKTIYNPPTHVRNILGNVPFADIASIAPWNPTNWKHYLSAARELSERGKDYRWLLRQGVVGSEYFGNEIRFVVKLLEGGESPFDVLTHRIHQAHGVAGRIYNIEDQIFKVAAYKKYRDKGMAPLAAAREVNRWFPNYGDLLRTTRWLSQIPLGGPFLAFNEQAARIAGRAAVRHPIKLLKWASLPGLLSALSIYWLGMDEEEEELLDKRRSYLEPVLPVRDDKGAARTFDLRYMTPLGNEVMGLLHKERIEVPMFLSQPLIGSAVDVMSNRDLFTGKNIVGEDDPAWTKLRKRAWHVLKDAAPVPTTVTWGYERVRRAFQGEGREGVSAAIAGALFGINTRAGYVQRQDAFARLRALAERDPEVAAVVEQLLGGDINRMNYKQLERDLEANEAFQELLSLYNDAYRRENQKPISGRGVLQSIRARNRKAG